MVLHYGWVCLRVTGGFYVFSEAEKSPKTAVLSGFWQQK